MHARRSIQPMFLAALLAMSTSAHGNSAVGWRYDGTGHYPDATPPTQWSTTENIRWSIPLEGWGNGSPIVIRDRVLFTMEPTWLVAVDRATGRLLWKAQNRALEAVTGEERAAMASRLAEAESHEATLQEEQRKLSRLKRSARKSRSRADSERLSAQLVDQTRRVTAARDALEASASIRTPPTGDIIGYASSTPISDGKRVFAIFGNGVVSAFDLHGRRLWSKWFKSSPKLTSRFLMHGHTEGHAASPRLVGDTLVVGFGTLMGLDASTGSVRWDAGTFRDYGTPALVDRSGTPSVVTAEGRWIRTEDGADLGGAGPHTYYTSPVVHGGQIFVTGATSDDAGRPMARASSWGASGARWTTELDRARYHVSPLVHQGLIYSLSVRGALRVLRASDGGLVYEKKLDLERPQVSFAEAGGLVFVFGAEGQALVLRPGERFEVIARNALGPLRSTPFFHRDAIYVRTHDRLYCVGAPAE